MWRYLALILFVAPAALAQGTLEVIPLRHRTVEQVLPILRPLLEAGGAMSGQSNQLIVRTSPENLAQIRAALEAIDRPARRLVISVRFDSTQQARRAGVETDARVSSRGSRADLRIAESQLAQDEHVDQRIQVLEGGRALIASGESRPLRQSQVMRAPGGAVVAQDTVIQEAATGFEVVPRLSGNTVFLDIAPQREQFVEGNSGRIRAERVASSVSGRLGEWIELGGASASGARTESGNFSSRERAYSGERRIWVKVEEARP